MTKRKPVKLEWNDRQATIGDYVVLVTRDTVPIRPSRPWWVEVNHAGNKCCLTYEGIKTRHAARALAARLVALMMEEE